MISGFFPRLIVVALGLCSLGLAKSHSSKNALENELRPKRPIAPAAAVAKGYTPSYEILEEYINKLAIQTEQRLKNLKAVYEEWLDAAKNQAAHPELMLPTVIAMEIDQLTLVMQRVKALKTPAEIEGLKKSPEMRQGWWGFVSTSLLNGDFDNLYIEFLKNRNSLDKESLTKFIPFPERSRLAMKNTLREMTKERLARMFTSDGFLVKNSASGRLSSATLDSIVKSNQNDEGVRAALNQLYTLAHYLQSDPIRKDQRAMVDQRLKGALLPSIGSKVSAQLDDSLSQINKVLDDYKVIPAETKKKMKNSPTLITTLEALRKNAFPTWQNHASHYATRAVANPAAAITEMADQQIMLDSINIFTQVADEMNRQWKNSYVPEIAALKLAVDKKSEGGTLGAIPNQATSPLVYSSTFATQIANPKAEKDKPETATLPTDDSRNIEATVEKQMEQLNKIWNDKSAKQARYETVLESALFFFTAFTEQK